MLMILLAGAHTLHAQQITYNHDADKMNQITVMEIGSGSLTPQYFYTVFHNSYHRSAARTNKLAYRAGAGLAGYKQVPMSDSIQEAMTKRAGIEALNIADRSGGAADVAWMAEGDKIKNKLDSYERKHRQNYRSRWQPGQSGTLERASEPVPYRHQSHAGCLYAQCRAQEAVSRHLCRHL
jgi:hypothetical protein